MASEASPHRIALFQISSLATEQILPDSRVHKFEGIQQFDLPLAVAFSETKHFKQSKSYAVASIFQSADEDGLPNSVSPAKSASVELMEKNSVNQCPYRQVYLLSSSPIFETWV